MAEQLTEGWQMLDRRKQAYGKESLQNINQEDGKILNRRQNIGQEDGRILDSKAAEYGQEDKYWQEKIAQENFRILDRDVGILDKKMA